MGTKGNLKIFLVGVGSEKMQSKTLLILILQQPILAHFFSKLSLNQPSPKAFLSTGMEIPGLPGMCIWHLLSGFKNFTFCQQIVRQTSIKKGCILYVLYVLMSHRTCRTLLYPVLKPFAHEKKKWSSLSCHLCWVFGFIHLPIMWTPIVWFNITCTYCHFPFGSPKLEYRILIL